MRLAVLLAIAGACTGAFYGGFAHVARQMVQEARLPAGHANAVKHAYAAAQTYRAIRLLGVPEASARALVIWLGEQNEWMESVVRPNDTTLEMLKDLCNNRIGITAAIWHERHPVVIGDVAFAARMRLLIHRGALRYRAEDALPPKLKAKPLLASRDPAKAIRLSNAVCGLHEARADAALAR